MICYIWGTQATSATKFIFAQTLYLRFRHFVWATSNMTLFLLLFQTLLLWCFIQFFAILLHCISSRLICTQILYTQSLLVGDTLYSLVPHILLWAHRTLWPHGTNQLSNQASNHLRSWRQSTIFCKCDIYIHLFENIFY